MIPARMMHTLTDNCACSSCTDSRTVHTGKVDCTCSMCSGSVGRIGRMAPLSASTVDDVILRRVDKWACVRNCGACCKLGPLDSRPDLKDVRIALNMSHKQFLRNNEGILYAEAVPRTLYTRNL
jgi:hypothetical protein